MSAVEELVRVLERPLRYLAEGSPRRLAPDALPTAPLLERIEQALGDSPGDGIRDRLLRLRELLAAFPLEDPDARRRAAREGLEAIRGLGEPDPVAVSGAGTGYRRSSGDPGPALEIFSSSVQFLKGVGPRRAAQLERLGLRTVEDVLYHLPFRYEDRRSILPLGELRPGVTASCIVEVVAAGEKQTGARRRLLEARVTDGTGSLTLTWFHHVGFFASRIAPGQKLLLHGRAQAGRGRLQMVHPELELLEDGAEPAPGILPVYEKPTDMTVPAMRGIVAAALEVAGRTVPSLLPEDVAGRQAVVDLSTALGGVHDPSPDADPEALGRGTSLGHRSIVFDELFFLELGMLLRKHALGEAPGIPIRPSGKLRAALLASLPWALTGAQERVLEEIGRDMARPNPMNRLVQGDVGSGKTIVAVVAALGAIECGYQVALMAPTEVLAEQHLRTIRGLVEPLGVEVDFLSGRTQGAARRDVLGRLATGDAPLVVGTHAIIQEGVTFARLGLGIVDEQHRFGVLQRQALQGQGENPDILLMTATPIPRTLALTLYGDLDLSFLDEMPPGRKPVTTLVLRTVERDRAWERVRSEVEGGRQAYVVAPLVEESEATNLRSARAMAEELATGPLRGVRIGLVHGQMKGEEKDAVMRRFQAGDHQVLVATTVIEVGVDVPNATVMVIDHAETFGLAQLHQLRGRVGRGTDRSWCLLVSTGTTGPAGLERLRLLERESEGVRVAEADLEQRGPGEFLGVRQSGLPDFRAANLVRDVRILQSAREEALAILGNDPGLRGEEARDLRRILEHRWKGRLGLAGVG